MPVAMAIVTPFNVRLSYSSSPHSPPLAVLVGVAIAPVTMSIVMVTIDGEAIDREVAWECVFPWSLGLVMAREG